MSDINSPTSPASDLQTEIAAWFHGRLPDDWFTEAAEVSVDREEIVVVGRVPAPEGSTDEADAGGRAAEEGRVSRFREDTRAARMAIAEEAQQRFGRTVSWGARCGGFAALFTHVAAPVMTRLRQPERLVLDTLIEAGVARSRSEAVSWCVRLVGEHEQTWLEELHDTLTAVREARAKGPESRRAG